MSVFNVVIFFQFCLCPGGSGLYSFVGKYSVDLSLSNWSFETMLTSKEVIVLVFSIYFTTKMCVIFPEKEDCNKVDLNLQASGIKRIIF